MSFYSEYKKDLTNFFALSVTHKLIMEKSNDFWPGQSIVEESLHYYSDFHVQVLYAKWLRFSRIRLRSEIHAFYHFAVILLFMNVSFQTHSYSET